MKPNSTLDDPGIPVTAFVEIDAACDRFEAAWRAGQDSPRRAGGRAMEDKGSRTKDQEG